METLSYFKYKFMGILGRGQFGEVYLVEDTAKNTYAMKIIPNTADNKSMIEKEASTRCA